MSYRRLSKEHEDDLMISLCRAVSSVKSPIEGSQLIKDLFTEYECKIISKRLEVARLLLKNLTFDQIHKVLKVSRPTIAKISLWLQTSGEGFRLVLERTKNEPKVRVQKENWSSLKRRYPQYYWPQILLERVVVSANKRELEEIKKTLGKLKEKTQLIRSIDALVSDQLRKH